MDDSTKEDYCHRESTIYLLVSELKLQVHNGKLRDGTEQTTSMLADNN